MCTAAAKVYQRRNPEAFPFFRLVGDYFDELEGVYAERIPTSYGFRRPVIRTAIDKFLKCEDLREGFARVRCPDCGGEMKVISFIEKCIIDKCQPVVVEKILRHCGLWKEADFRPPPQEGRVAAQEPSYDYGYDYSYFDRVCIQRVLP